ncbi:PrpF family protein [Acuticoccus sediminis]|uniref:PrpF family protein n=1 Tax=Acuticoccus sediminis TaxID=2184697 RepID=A0A8B2NUV4_9HYPH|nr:PrpF domain-containing protein [Acuticoccus sediminis]RAI02088.1 PrpF family protein [Acuticoccus sediminis]
MATRQSGYRAVFMRGGTSKAVIFRDPDIPADPDERHAMFLRLMGSPDPARRQLDGLGGGVSSLSKVCIVGPSAREDADVDYTFAQIPVTGTTVDYSANCGNMSSAIGPFAVEEGLVAANGDEATVRIFNANTSKIIVSRFPVRDGLPVVEGDFVNPGVAGSGAPIRLDFLDPGGATTGRLLPTGSPVDTFEHPDLPGPVEASLVDATNMVAFVPAAFLGASGIETPDAIEADATLMHRLELLRRLASVRAGLSADEAAAGRIEGNPKVALVSAPRPYALTSGESVGADGFDVGVRIISMGQAHRAITLTGALCTAVAARIPGTVVASAARVPAAADTPVRIGHSSGILPAVSDVVTTDGALTARSAGVFRTARRLMEGQVYA